VIHICEQDQQDAHFFLLTYSNQIIQDMFRTNNCSSSGGTDINHIVSATRLLIKMHSKIL